MFGNIYLFTGEERFLLDKELERWIFNFSEKFGKDSIFIFNSENRDNGTITQNIFGGGLFSNKKLIIFRGVPVSAERQTGFDSDSLNDFIDKFTKSIDSIPADNLIVFLSYNPDKRGRLYKFLEKNVQIKEFKKMGLIELKNLIKNELGEIKISENMMTYFIDKVGEDPYRITSEIDKLREYCNIHNILNIDEKLIDEITFGQTETVAFGFMELLFKDKDKAIKYLDMIKEGGTNRNEFAGALYYQLKMDIILDDYSKKGINDSKQIAAECKLNPRVVSNNMKNIKQISKNGNEIKNMYKGLVDLDVGIKTGKKKDDEFRLKIKQLGLQFK